MTLKRREDPRRASAHPADGGAMQPGLDAFPPVEAWDSWSGPDVQGGSRGEPRDYTIVPTTCFNCESACGLLAYVDTKTGEVRKYEGNPLHPGSRGRNCAKGPATITQTHDPERILYPMRRVGARGAGGWERCTWDEALDDLAGRIRAALGRGEPNRIMYHVGRPGEDGFTERVLAAWGVDGHNSHTNICSAGGRAGYAFWMGFDRPSPDYANAKVIFLISAHLESGHYFNPHAQRIIDGRRNGAKMIVVDPRLSNTASQADEWLAAWPGSEPALLLSIARHLIVSGRFDRAFVERWVNWADYLAAARPDLEHPVFDDFVAELERLYGGYTFDYAERETGVPAAQIEQVAELVAGAGTALAAHNWRASSAGVVGGWQTARCLFFLNVLTGSVGTPGGTSPNGWDKWVPRPPYMPPHPGTWNDLTWPREYPLAFFEMSFLLPHFLLEGRGSLDVYFTRVYNPVWTNPDGLTWVEALRREDLIGRHAALTPVWSESAWYADYVLPVGLAGERHDLHSYETHAGSWIGFRQPVTRVAAERAGRTVGDTRDTNPGEVWEENEFWIELSWRIDPDGSLGIRRWFEAPDRPGQRMTVDDYYGWIFEHSVPGLPEAAAAEGITPLAYMRRYGAFEIEQDVYGRHDDPVATTGAGVVVGSDGAIHGPAPKDPPSNIVPAPAIPRDPEGRVRQGILVQGEGRRGFPTPSGRLEFYSPTLAEWGWDELAVPSYVTSQVARERMTGPNDFALVPTFRLPVLIHTRSANAKWLAEIAHGNPVWIHPEDAARIGVATGDLVRVETDIGHYVNRTWVTEGIRPGVVACSHHMGRWRLGDDAGTDRWASARVDLVEDQADASEGAAIDGPTGAMPSATSGARWRMRRLEGVAPFPSSDPDTSRIWWRDAGVHQNLTFPVHPDPVSGAHAWHQKVVVRPALPADREGDISVDTRRSRAIYREWLELARPGPGPGGLRRPEWLLRPLRPTPSAYRVGDAERPPASTPSATIGESGQPKESAHR
jgi:anaerobic selenocysteine-containing dehydrogenase